MSIFRYEWVDVDSDDVEKFRKKNDLKYLRDKSGNIIAVDKNNYKRIIFRFVPDEYLLYSDYTLIDLDMGRAKSNPLKESIVQQTVRHLDESL